MELTAISFFDLVRADLKAVEAELRAAIPEHPQALNAAVNRLVSSGGKRLRPTLALLAARLLDCDRQKMVWVAAAIETLHTATLVHDDLVDGSLLRRGLPTLNVAWSPSATVLTGDYLFARAAQFAAKTDSVPLTHEFARTLETIISGELNQLFASQSPASRDAYFERIYAKTAALFALAAQAAALLTSADEAICEALRTFGREMGMAFQIMDDILDFAGDESKLGKPVGSDLRQGLITLPALCYLETQPGDRDLAAVLKGARNSQTVARAVQAVICSGAIDAARQEAQAYVARAHAALALLPDNAYRHGLAEMADYVVRRNV